MMCRIVRVLRHGIKRELQAAVNGCLLVSRQVREGLLREPKGQVDNLRSHATDQYHGRHDRPPHNEQHLGRPHTKERTVNKVMQRQPSSLVEEMVMPEARVLKYYTSST